MKNFGIKFSLKDGTVDYYDPLDHNDISETDTDYILDMTYTYEIPKDTVVSYEWYDVCQECGHEIYYDGCRNCYVNEE